MNKASRKQRRFAESIDVELPERISRSDASKILHESLDQRRAVRHSHPALSNELAKMADIPPQSSYLGKKSETIRSLNYRKGDIVQTDGGKIGVYLGQDLNNPFYGYVFLLQEQSTRHRHLQGLETVHRFTDNDYVHCFAAFEPIEKSFKNRTEDIREFTTFVLSQIKTEDILFTEYGTCWRKTTVQKLLEAFNLFRSQPEPPKQAVEILPRYCFVCGTILHISISASYCPQHKSLNIGKDRKRYCTQCGKSHIVEKGTNIGKQRYCSEHLPVITDPEHIAYQNKMEFGRANIRINVLTEKYNYYVMRCETINTEIQELHTEKATYTTALEDNHVQLTLQKRQQWQKRCAQLEILIQNKQNRIAEYRRRNEEFMGEIRTLEARCLELSSKT